MADPTLHPTAFDHLRAVARAYPGSYEEMPWGELAVKVNKKVFLFLSRYEGRMNVTTKIPSRSAEAVAEYAFAKPTGYGLGRSGWVSTQFGPEDEVPVDLLTDWLEESYRCVAPKRLSKTVPEGGPAPVPPAPMPAVPAGAACVVVVSDGPLRCERAQRGLAEAGVRGLCVPGTDEGVGAVVDEHAVALIVDLGRNKDRSAEVAGELALLHFDAPLVLAGIRDAGHERATREALPAAALYSRNPPGDPALIAEVLTLIP